MELTSMTDEEFLDHQNAVIVEAERRRNVSPDRIAQIKELTGKFLAGGGNPDDLTEAAE